MRQIQTTQKESRRKVGQCAHEARHSDSILMSKDRRLPEASLDDGSTAELGGLEKTGTAIRDTQSDKGTGYQLTSFNLSSICTVISQSTQASVMLTPYLSPDGPNAEKCISITKVTTAQDNRTILRNILPATVDIGLDHYTSDRTVASNHLLAD